MCRWSHQSQGECLIKNSKCDRIGIFLFIWISKKHTPRRSQHQFFIVISQNWTEKQIPDLLFVSDLRLSMGTLPSLSGVSAQTP